MKFMKMNNKVGTTIGYIERIEASYENCGLSVQKIQNYFHSSDKYLALSGETETL